MRLMVGTHRAGIRPMLSTMPHHCSDECAGEMTRTREFQHCCLQRNCLTGSGADGKKTKTKQKPAHTPKQLQASEPMFYSRDRIKPPNQRFCIVGFLSDVRDRVTIIAYCLLHSTAMARPVSPVLQASFLLLLFCFLFVCFLIRNESENESTLNLRF